MNKNLILILLLMSIVTPTTFAKSNDCAIVSTRVTFLEKNEYKLKLFHLGKVKSVISLSPGRHKLSAQVMYTKNNATVNHNTLELINNEDVSAQIIFEIDVKKNTTYQIVAKTKGKHNRKSNRSFKISIKKEIAQHCESDKQSIVMNEPQEDNHSNTIPENLQYRLDLVMMDIKEYLSSNNLNNKGVTIAKEQRMMNTIGIVPNSKTPVTKGINILAITPFSTAAKIGLKPDDTILSINGIDLTLDHKKQGNKLSTLAIFKNVLVKLSENESVKIEVIRKDKKLILMSNYKALSLPSYQLKMTVN
ncbi:MAG: PDZ domain-containing protein [Colwellia sp.]|nr:PDZ domain-containing protein [Colwellia sp.]